MIHVACAADAAYVPHAATLMRSLIAQQAPSTLTFHFLHTPELSRAPLGQLRDFVQGHGARFQAHAIDEARLAGLPTMGRISRVMWLRVFLPELLEEPRVLYLDCDTLALAPIDELWRTDLGGALAGAVSNVFEQGQEARVARLGLAGPAAYFNSGVLLLDLDGWRRERCPERILALARDPQSGLVWPDQDALNTVLAGRWHALHPRWNCQNSLFFFRHAADVFGAAAVREATRAPGLLHFEGGELAKPWHYLCKHPRRAEYHRLRAQTPWPVAPIEGRSLTHTLLKPLPIGLLLPTLKFIRRAQVALQRRLPRRWSTA